MNEIYDKALKEIGTRGAPIFLTNLVVSKSQFFGSSKVPKKTFLKAKKIVASGTIEQIKKDKQTLFSALVLILGDKKKASTVDIKAYKIEEVEIVSFHGYSFQR